MPSLMPWLLGSLPPPDVIRRKAEEVVARPEYQLDSSLDPEALSLWLRLLLWLLTPVRWFLQALDGLPDVLRWIIVIGLTVVLVALLVHIVWTFVSAVRGTARIRSTPASRVWEVTPEQLEQAAADAVSMGDYITAVRKLFQASLKRIEWAEDRPLRRGITNRELLRRYGSSPFGVPLGEIVETIETKWYGHEICQVSDYEHCRSEYARLCRLLSRQSIRVSSPESSGVRLSDAIRA